MHNSSIQNIVLWYAAHFDKLRGGKIADLGAYNINGSVKEFLPEQIVGIDICEGPGVDVVIKPGAVPYAHLFQYDAVISANAFHLCGEPEKYLGEVSLLLKRDGLFVLTMCRPDCTQSHRTSPNEYGYGDGLRMQPDELRAFWEKVLTVEDVYIEGHDLVLWGSRK